MGEQWIGAGGNLTPEDDTDNYEEDYMMATPE